MGLKQALGRSARSEVIEVIAPEFPDDNGEPSVIRFRGHLTVGDLERISNAPRSVLNFKLFECLALNEDGGPLVDPDDSKWVESLDVLKVGAVVVRARLFEKVFLAQVKPNPEEKGSDSDPLA